MKLLLDALQAPPHQLLSQGASEEKGETARLVSGLTHTTKRVLQGLRSLLHSRQLGRLHVQQTLSRPAAAWVGLTHEAFGNA